MTAIPFPLSSAPGAHPQESAGRIINGFAEPLGQESPNKIAWRRAPGITAFGTTAESGYRGGIVVGGTFYGAWENKVYSFTSGGGAGALVGTLPGTAKISWARNNKAPVPDLVAVSPGDGAFLVSSGSVSIYPDADVGQPNSVCFLAGFFNFTYGSAQVVASDLNDTAIDPLNFATAESRPDSLLRGIPLPSGQLLLAGSSSMEVWGSPINTTGFPFSYVTTIPRGVAGYAAIAGHEEGFGKGIVFVGDDSGVYLLEGYTPNKISPPDLDRLIEAVEDKTTIEVGVFVAGGHPCAAVSADDWTWVFDINTQKWHERQSYLINRWRGTQPSYAFGKWLVGDTQSGNLGYIDSTAKTEFSQPLRKRLESGPANAFPVRMTVRRADFRFTTGVGVATGSDPNQTDPQAEISWTDDGGETWSYPVFRKLGRQQTGKFPITVLNTGRTSQHGRRWRIDVSDAVTESFLGGDMSVSAAGKS